MPRKLRELVKELEMAGFVDRGGKGSHRNIVHASVVVLTLSGRAGDDALPYQVKLVREKIEESRG
jgi:predicted RNA binding protein YcfA (HicA-like mRNA interferase family)